MAAGAFGGRKPQMAKAAARPQAQMAKPTSGFGTMPTMGAPSAMNKWSTALGPAGAKPPPAMGLGYGMAKGALPGASPAAQLGMAAGARNAMQQQYAAAKGAGGGPQVNPDMQARMNAITQARATGAPQPMTGPMAAALGRKPVMP